MGDIVVGKNGGFHLWLLQGSDALGVWQMPE